ncbi:MAG TPA: hypothetical protein VE398_24645 [Acidobacteriota bacterium]|nr:hypothetical protein [Acidobacteriota bacterium]
MRNDHTTICTPLLLSIFLILIPAPRLASEGDQAAAGNAITLAAGPDWIPLNLELDIVPGSALDFSKLGWLDAPAGKYGRVIARSDGQFAFEKNPRLARRFYGINLCFGAQYMKHEEADRLAERLMRLGYNSVRFHHYEGLLVQGQEDTTTLNPERLDQLDYLYFALARRGLYVTTDLFVSRPVTFREIGVDRDGPVGMDHFKVLVPVHEGAWQNWKEFSRALLVHVNPYTHLRYGDDPALAWLSLINEGNFGNFLPDIRTIPEWKKAWNSWLAKRYDGRPALATAWGEDLKENENQADGTVELPTSLSGAGLRSRDCIEFFSAVDVEMTNRMIAFVRNELGCKALITNTNSWTNHVTSQSARSLYDYVDDHFYVDHPRFLEKSWQLPSRCPNTSPVAQGAVGGRDRCFTRLFDKPFTITEYNYSAPGRFRGVGGILTGAMGSLQDWAGIWRFAYSHSREAELEPARMDYFNMASDPLGQASERASLCLFLRGDMKPAPHRVVIAMTSADLHSPPLRIPTLAPRWHWMAWLTRVGTQVFTDPSAAAAFSAVLPLGWSTPPANYGGNRVAADISPYQVEDTKLLEFLKARGIVLDPASADPGSKIFKSETGEITLDGPRDTMILDTPRTAGGYAPAGQTIRTADGGFVATISGSDATLWVSSLDNRVIQKSRRLLLTHLTDLQNTDIKYAEEARQTLLAWGKLPHLVRSGKAAVRISLSGAAKFQVWALSSSGRRTAQVKTSVKDKALEFAVDVSADPGGGARMLYEIARLP